MNKKIKLLIVTFALALFCLLLVSCSNKNVYDGYDDDGYNVTIKYDANGGYFGTTINQGITDTYNISNYEKNANGMVEIMLFPPNSEQRVDGTNKENQYFVTRDGYYLAGWFAKKTEVKDENDEVIGYEYSERWDFSKPYVLDPSKEYSANNPTLTLHAVWNKKDDPNSYHKIEIYDIDNPNTLLAEYLYGSGKEPTEEKSKEIKLPVWDKRSGELTYGVFDSLSGIKIDGKTLDAIYLDKDGKTILEGETYMHPVFVNDHGKLENRVLKLYFKYKEGNWYKIYSAAQLGKINNADANYELMADLDFSKATWPSNFRKNTFTGKIIGNGFEIKNVKISSDNSQYFGMFKEISKDAVIENVKFSNLNATLEKAYKNPGGRYALFAAVIQDGFKFTNVTIEASTLNIAANSKDAIVTDNYEVALLCAEGYSESLGVDISGISYNVLIEEYDMYTLTIELGADHNKLLLTFNEVVVE